MDGIFVDFWGSRIFVDVVFRLFFKRSAKKVENPIEAPQPEISLEGVIPSDTPGGQTTETCRLLGTVRFCLSQ